MQNKPNLQKSQMNVTIFSKMAYEYKYNWTLSEKSIKNADTSEQKSKFLKNY